MQVLRLFCFLWFHFFLSILFSGSLPAFSMKFRSSISKTCNLWKKEYSGKTPTYLYKERLTRTFLAIKNSLSFPNGQVPKLNYISQDFAVLIYMFSCSELWEILSIPWVQLMEKSENIWASVSLRLCSYIWFLVRVFWCLRFWQTKQNAIPLPFSWGKVHLVLFLITLYRNFFLFFFLFSLLLPNWIGKFLRTGSTSGPEALKWLKNNSFLLTT